MMATREDIVAGEELEVVWLSITPSMLSLDHY